jgi:hypothetical protein
MTKFDNEYDFIVTRVFFNDVRSQNRLLIRMYDAITIQKIKEKFD